MGHSFVKMRVHLLWATKRRRKLLAPEWRMALFERFVAIPSPTTARVLCVGGVRDHVHLLVGWSPAVALSTVARDLKTWSSWWIRQTIPGQEGFSWQSGYSAFTVGPKGQSRVIDYLLHQEAHHCEPSRVGGWVIRRNSGMMVAVPELPRPEPAACSNMGDSCSVAPGCSPGPGEFISQDVKLFSGPGPQPGATEQ
jgi:REP element-mobilizing transposase RayT